MMRSHVVDAMISGVHRAHYPRGEEVKEAIEQLGSAMTVLGGWIQTMSDDELAHLREALRRSLVIVDEEGARRGG